MLYELRHYDIEGERGLTFVSRRFAEHVIPAFTRAGVEPVGFWTVFVGAQSPRLTYMLAWNDLGERERKWSAFEADEEWRRARRDTNDAYGGSPIHTITNMFLRPTASSPAPRWNTQPRRLEGGIFEHRVYAFQDYEGQALCERWFSERAFPLMEKHGLHVMGLWSVFIGPTPRLALMLVFESLASVERAWATLHTDPEWAAVEDALYVDGNSLIKRTDSCLMRGTEFSGWR